MLAIQTYHPKTLSHWIKSFWCLEAGAHDAYEEMIIPDGHTEIIFCIAGQAARRQDDSGSWLAEPSSFIASQTLETYRLRLAAGTRLYGIRFYPHSLFQLLRVPLDRLPSEVVALQDILHTRDLENCIGDDTSSSFHNLERHLYHLLSGYHRDDAGYQYVGHAVGRILQLKGLISVKELIRSTGISVRYQDNLFRKFTGITPKTLAGIVRLNHFISFATTHPQKNLTEITYETGYYDQSHLIKNFHLFTGRSPRDYFKSNSQISNHFSFL